MLSVTCARNGGGENVVGARFSPVSRAPLVSMGTSKVVPGTWAREGATASASCSVWNTWAWNEARIRITRASRRRRPLTAGCGVWDGNSAETWAAPTVCGARAGRRVACTYAASSTRRRRCTAMTTRIRVFGPNGTGRPEKVIPQRLPSNDRRGRPRGGKGPGRRARVRVGGPRSTRALGRKGTFRVPPRPRRSPWPAPSAGPWGRGGSRTPGRPPRGR